MLFDAMQTFIITNIIAVAWLARCCRVKGRCEGGNAAGTAAIVSSCSIGPPLCTCGSNLVKGWIPLLSKGH